MLNISYSNLLTGTQEGKKIKKGRILYWQCYYKAKTFVKVRYFYLTTHFVPELFPRSHLDDYWIACTEKGFTPATPKDWVAPVGWVAPNERNMINL